MSEPNPSPRPPPAAAPSVERERALGEEFSQLADDVGPVELVARLLHRAFSLSATDIHLDPREDGLHLRLRIDGVLHDAHTFEPVLAQQVISRLKLMAGMDITERRLPQDGHIGGRLLQSQRDIRAGSGPTIHGERLVLRLMPDSSQLTRLEDLGLDDRQIHSIQQVLQSPHGMVLCVGPVGCGKSTTTYACLALVNRPALSLTTIEDPVERRIPGVNQIQIDPRIDFGFPQALRAVLRQDPDVMMVGEIRDSETASIAVRAALTGIRLLSTMHASHCVAVIDVLRQFGVPPMFVADAVGCVIAQRLLRIVCPTSRQTYRPDVATAQRLGLSQDDARETQLVRGIPAEANFHTGYAGRTGVFEVLRMDPTLREAIIEGRSGTELQGIAVRAGMATLEQSAIDKVLAQVTSVDEMRRALVL